jgi:hypothetical protein
LLRVTIPLCQNTFWQPMSSDSSALLKQFLEDYSGAAARYHAAVAELSSRQGIVPAKEYERLKAVVAQAREEASRTREALASYRQQFSISGFNGGPCAPNGSA